MKLFWGPGTCAIGIQILLEEAGLTYETERLDVGAGETRQPPFSNLNPKGKVPTLMRDDGSVLTEFGAIATWIARRKPEAGLLPVEPELEARVVETMSYVEGTIHGQGFGRLFAPELFAPGGWLRGTLGLGLKRVRRQGREIVEEGFSILDVTVGSGPFAVGEGFTIADAALFYAERWAPKNQIALPPNVQRHFQAMLERSTVRRVRTAWGEG